MTLSLNKTAQAIVDAAVASGRHASPEAAVEAGLALPAEREKKLAWLQDELQRSIAEGGSHTGDEVAESVEAALDNWERQRKKNKDAAE
jgi:antitoxin ParD1/3/4